MRLRSIQIQNYRRYRSVDLELPDGLVSIIGPNGSGKSTLMEAVSWALFGNQSEIVRSGKDSIKRQGAAHTDPCMVRIEFDFEDTGYIVERSMKGKNLTMSAIMYAGDNAIARGTEEVSLALMKLFGMDHKSFFISVFARQKELNALTSQPKGERKKMVLRLLDIESIDTAIRKIREDARYARNAIQSASDDLVNADGSSSIDTLERELVELASREKELTSSSRESEVRLKNIENIHRKLKKELEGQERLARQKDKLESSRQSLETRLSTLKEQEQDMSDDIKLLARVEEQFQELEPKSARIQKDLAGILDKQNMARDELNDVVGQISELKTRQKQLRKEISKIRASMSEIEDMGPESDCPTCERRLGPTYQKLLDAFNDQINDREKRISELSGKISGAEDKQAEIRALSEALTRREKRLAEKQRDFETLRGKVERGEKLRKRQKELQEKLKDVRDQMKDTTKELAGIEFDKKSYEKSRTLYDDMNIELRNIDRQRMKYESEMARLEERVRSHDRELSRLRNVKKKFEKKKAEADMLAALETVMGDFRRHLISRIRPALANMSSELLGVLTDGRYNEMELNEDYEISIRDAGEMHRLDRFSGGEKDLANLCLRLAISEIIATRYGTNSFDMIVLDEIFGSQDANRKRTLLVTLNGLSNRFKQIFLITHVEDVKEIMGNIIQVSEADDGTSMAEVMS